jgi:hypothetical protein
MVSKEERDHEDQHMGHVAFRIPDFWPHDLSTWFGKIESKFRICNIKQSSTKYDHLLSALPTDICSSINDSLAEIDEKAADAYEQLKALLMSRYTMDRWARAFELHKFKEIVDMKPSEMMRQMKALLPPDATAGTYFMAAFLLRLPADMIDHMDSILKHLPFVFCYFDDIIIASNSLEEHIEHLRQIFTILQENGLQINPAKCFRRRRRRVPGTQSRPGRRAAAPAARVGH